MSNDSNDKSIVGEAAKIGALGAAAWGISRLIPKSGRGAIAIIVVMPLFIIWLILVACWLKIFGINVFAIFG